MEFLEKEEIDNLIFTALKEQVENLSHKLDVVLQEKDFYKEQVENLSHKLDVALQERDFYKDKYEELQVKAFLNNFTVEEQVKILSEVDK